MLRIVILGLAALSISACATTQRGEVRAGRDNVEKQHKELAAAKRNGTINEVREERNDLSEAQRELRKDQKKLYTPGADGSLARGLEIGQRESGELPAVPLAYQSQYRDGNGIYYRSDGKRIYKIKATDHTVLHVYLMGG